MSNAAEMSPPAAVSAIEIFWFWEVRWVAIFVRRGWKVDGGKDILAGRRGGLNWVLVIEGRIKVEVVEGREAR